LSEQIHSSGTRPSAKRSHRVRKRLFGELPDATFRGFARGLDAVVARRRELLVTQP